VNNLSYLPYPVVKALISLVSAFYDVAFVPSFAIHCYNLAITWGNLGEPIQNLPIFLGSDSSA